MVLDTPAGKIEVGGEASQIPMREQSSKVVAASERDALIHDQPLGVGERHLGARQLAVILTPPACGSSRSGHCQTGGWQVLAKRIEREGALQGLRVVLSSRATPGRTRCRCRNPATRDAAEFHPS